MKIIPLLLLCQVAFAYLPTPESLFRNQSNKPIKAELVGMQWGVLKKVEGQWQDQGTLGVNLDRLKQQVYWNNAHLGSSFPISFALLLYSFRSLAFNDGINIINFLKKMGTPIYTNQELVDEEKTQLLNRYISHLQKGTGSPFSMGSREQRLYARKLLNQNHFVDRNLVKLHKWHNEFYWKIEADNFTALFDNKKHRLKTIDYTKGAVATKIVYENYRHDTVGRVFPHLIFMRKGDDEIRLTLKSLIYNGKVNPVAAPEVPTPFVF